MPAAPPSGGPDREPRSPVGILLPPGVTHRVAVVLATVLVLSALGHAVVGFLPLLVDLPGQRVLSVLDLGEEQAVGTWVTAVLHLGCAVLAGLLGLLARSEASRWTANWWLLSAAFTILSLDEVAAVHDRLLDPIRDALGTSGLLYYAWVVPALALGALFLVVQLRFLRHLGRTGRDLALAGAVFVSGAAGLEMLEGLLASEGDRDTPLYELMVMVEELLELAGVMWALCILLRHLVTRLPSTGSTVPSDVQPVTQAT